MRASEPINTEHSLLMSPDDDRVTHFGGRTKRVLIAEYLNARVVEMDFQGKELWSYKIDQPIGCQLLPNGSGDFGSKGLA